MRGRVPGLGENAAREGDGVVYTAAAVDDLSHDGRPGQSRRVAEVVTSLFRLR